IGVRWHGGASAMGRTLRTIRAGAPSRDRTVAGLWTDRRRTTIRSLALGWSVGRVGGRTRTHAQASRRMVPCKRVDARRARGTHGTLVFLPDVAAGFDIEDAEPVRGGIKRTPLSSAGFIEVVRESVANVAQIFCDGVGRGCRTFGICGPPGSGLNTAIRSLARS